MYAGGGEAADQTVRLMLTGCEAVVRLGGSGLKNALAITLALAKNNKQISGKVKLGKMLQETRDLRVFPMSREQYRQFAKMAKPQKLLYAVIKDTDKNSNMLDVVLPAGELERANFILEKMLYSLPVQNEQTEKTEQIEIVPAPAKEQEEKSPKKESRLVLDWSVSKNSSSICKESRNIIPTTSEPESVARRPSIESRLKEFQAQIDKINSLTPTRNKTKQQERGR